MKNLLKVIIVFLILAEVVSAQQEFNIKSDIKVNQTENPSANQGKNYLTGILQLDYYSLQQSDTNSTAQYKLENMGSKKSPVLAGFMSLLVPGAGELYSGSYWKTAAFLAIEAAAITFAIKYNNKGDRQTDFFQNFADQNWSVTKYARWTVEHAKEISQNPNFNTDNYKVFNTDGSVNWGQLNELESDLGNWYSHTLPAYGKQQYYELIGKYQQFNMGWDDAVDSPDNPYTYGKPLSSNFLYYSKERGKANDLYAVASTYIKILVVNHFLSAIDAAWSASRYNKKLSVSMQMKEINIAGQYEMNPQLNFKFNF